MKKAIFIALALALIAGVVVLTAAQEEKNLIDDKEQLFGQVQLLADSITLISTDYVEPVEASDLVHGAITGMMNTLDGYSQFLDQDSFREIKEETKGEFGGVGIEIGMREGILTVISPIEDTPAFDAGILPGDKIVKIDGEITQDMTLDDAVKKLRGKPGTEVTLTVIREEEEKIVDLKIKRAVIKIKSIKDSRLIEDDIAYIKLIEFQERTAGDLREAIRGLRARGAEDLIIDLRNNPGGLLDSSIEVADLFLEPGKLIVYTEGRDPEKRMEFRAKKGSDFGDMGIIVIVNKGSASASEILAGALMDNRRALVVGEPTFGKGSVQTVIPLKDNTALRLTTAAYYTPSGKNLMDKGIEPDILVKKIQQAEKEGSSEEEQREMEKERIFKKVKDKSVDRSAGEKEKGAGKEEKKLKYDNQVQAAVNVLKGMRIFQRNQQEPAAAQDEPGGVEDKRER